MVSTPADEVDCMRVVFANAATTGWRMCPEGRYLNGITSNRAGGEGMSNLNGANCCGAARAYQRAWGACADVNVSTSFERGGKQTCPAGMALTGFFVSDAASLEGLDTLRCCQIVAAPPVDGLEGNTVASRAGDIDGTTYTLRRGDRLLEGGVLLSPAKQHKLMVEGGGQLAGVAGNGAIFFHSNARLAGGSECWLEIGSDDESAAAVATYCRFNAQARAMVWQLAVPGSETPVTCPNDDFAELTVTRTGRLMFTCGGSVFYASDRPAAFPGCGAYSSCGACVNAESAGGAPRCAWRDAGFHGLARCADAIVAEDPLLSSSVGTTIAAGDAASCSVRVPIAYVANMTSADRLFPGDTLTSLDGMYVIEFDASGSLMARATVSAVPFWRANAGLSGAFNEGCHARVVDRTSLSAGAASVATGKGFLRAGASLARSARVLSDAGYFAMEILPNGDLGVRQVSTGVLTWNAGAYGVGRCAANVATVDGSVTAGCSHGSNWTTGVSCPRGNDARFGPTDVGGVVQLCDGAVVWSDDASVPGIALALSSLEIVCPSGSIDWTSAESAEEDTEQSISVGELRLVLDTDRSVAVHGGQAAGGPVFGTRRAGCYGAASCDECVSPGAGNETCVWSSVGFPSVGGARCAAEHALAAEDLATSTPCTVQARKIQSPLVGSLRPGDELRSPNFRYFAKVTARGALVVGDDDGNVYWSSGADSDDFEGCALQAVDAYPLPGATYILNAAEEIDLAYEVDSAAEEDADEGVTNVDALVAGVSTSALGDSPATAAVPVVVDADTMYQHSALAVKCVGYPSVYKTVGTVPCSAYYAEIVLDNNGQLKLECSQDSTLPSLAIARPAHVCSDALSCAVCTDPAFSPTGLEGDDGCVWSRVGFSSGVSCAARSRVALAGDTALVSSTCGSSTTRTVYDTLAANDALFAGDRLVSSRTGTSLEVLSSGQLALRSSAGALLWSSPPAAMPERVLDDCSLVVNDLLGGLLLSCKVHGVPTRIFTTHSDETHRSALPSYMEADPAPAALTVGDGLLELARAPSDSAATYYDTYYYSEWTAPLWTAPGCSERAPTCEACTGAADGMCAWRAAGFVSASGGLAGERCVRATVAAEAGLLDLADSVQQAACPAAARALGNALESGDTLRAGDRLASTGGAYALEMRADGDLLAIEIGSGGDSGAVFWQSGTDGHLGEQCVAAVEPDGLHVRCGSWPDVEANNGDLGVRMVDVWAATIECEGGRMPRIELTPERQLQPYCGGEAVNPSAWAVGATLPGACVELRSCGACAGASVDGNECVWKRDGWDLASRCAPAVNVSDAADGIAEVASCPSRSVGQDIYGGLDSGAPMYAGDRLWSADGEYFLEVTSAGAVELRVLRTARLIWQRLPEVAPEDGDDCFLLVAEHGVWNMACGSPLYALWTNEDVSNRVLPSQLCDAQTGEAARLVVTDRHELEVLCVPAGGGPTRSSYTMGVGFATCRDIVDCGACTGRDECDWNGAYWPWEFSGWPVDEGGVRTRCTDRTVDTEAFTRERGDTCSAAREALEVTEGAAPAAATSRTQYFGELTGGVLQAGETIMSPGAKFAAALQPDGNLVFATVGGSVFWQSFTADISDEECVFQLEAAGNVTAPFSLVCGGAPLWSFPLNNPSPCTAGAIHALTVTDGRQLQLRCDGVVAGDAGTDIAGETDSIQPGQWGGVGDFALYSPDMAYELVFTEAGDLKLRDHGAARDVWAAGAVGKGCLFGMDVGEGMPKYVCPAGGDGCGLETVPAVGSAPGVPNPMRVQAVGGASCGVSTVWSTGRACATPDAELVLQSDRDMVHLCGGSRLWATDTVKTFKSDGICEVVDAKQCDAAVPEMLFEQEYKNGSDTVWRLKQKATGKCVFCPPFALEELPDGTWAYDRTQTLGEVRSGPSGPLLFTARSR